MKHLNMYPAKVETKIFKGKKYYYIVSFKNIFEKKWRRKLMKHLECGNT